MGRDFEIGPPRLDEAGAVATADVQIPEDLVYLEGHFPGHPIVPGLAQVVLVEQTARAAFPGLGPLASLARVKFQETLGPGDALTLRLTREGGRVRFDLTRQGRTCSTGSLSFR